MESQTPMKQSLWKQFGAAIDMLENAVAACPQETWDHGSKFWYNAYHAIFYLDYYLTEEPATFHPPAPFSLSEFDPAGILPERVYTKEELLNYLAHCREKCRQLIAGLTEEKLQQHWENAYRHYPVFEILIYNLRHLQHHTGQLNLLLRQGIDDAPAWVSQTKQDL